MNETFIDNVIETNDNVLRLTKSYPFMKHSYSIDLVDQRPFVTGGIVIEIVLSINPDDYQAYPTDFGMKSLKMTGV